MQPPVEFRDRSNYKRTMNELLKIDPNNTVVVTVDEFKAKIQTAKVLQPAAAR